VKKTANSWKVRHKKMFQTKKHANIHIIKKGY